MAKVLPGCIPDELLARRRSLSDIGSADAAWEFQDAVHVLEALRDQPVAILGGDILTVHDSVMAHTYDNWSSERGEGESQELYARRSQKQALDYLRRYKARKDQLLIVSLVMSSEPTAAM